MINILKFKMIAMVRTLLNRDFRMSPIRLNNRTFINGKSLPYFRQRMYKTFVIDESLIGDIRESLCQRVRTVIILLNMELLIIKIPLKTII